VIENDTQQIIIKIPQKEIVFVDMVFKSHEGLAMLTLNHDQEGMVYLDVTEGTRGDVLKIISELGKKFPAEIIKK